MKILISGFKPFGADSINPTELIVNNLPNKIGDIDIYKIVLPVEFIKAPELLIQEYEIVKPDALIMLGQAGRRDAITPEVLAKNIMDGSKLPDNNGFAPDKLMIDPQGLSDLRTTLPVKEIVHGLNKIGINAKMSYDAGSYVCNDLFYSLLNHTKKNIPEGFIHVPFIKEQNHPEYPYMELSDIEKAIIEIISIVAKHKV